MGVWECGSEAKLVEVPKEIANLRVSVRRFVFEHDCAVRKISVRSKDYPAVRWMAFQAGLGIEVKRDERVREGHVVLWAGG